ncbi:ATP-binding protein [Desulfobacterales bacterium HSG17]|nr:ATP-binding protein [Desulfobacterales bacterium HSG17]
MSKPKILIVEDDSIVAMDIETRLKKFGYDVCGKVGFAEKAIEKAEELNPDLVLMDIVLKGEMDGIKAAQIIQIRFSIPIVFVTAHADEQRFERAKITNPFGYVLKPFKDRDLKITIEMALYKSNVDAEIRKAEKEKIKLQSQLFNSYRMESVGRLAAGIAHEINNPIGYIGSNLETLSDYMGNIEELLQHYQELGQSIKKIKPTNLSEKINNQIQTIFDYEKNIDIDYIRKDIPQLLKDCSEGTWTAGKIVNDLKSFALPGQDRLMPVDINKGLESTLNVVYSELKDKVSVIRDFREISLVDGYPQKLNQVFMNFVLNAAQAIKAKGEIKIQTKQEGKNVVITISDNGCGIEKEHLPKIFDPFFTTQEVGKGTGLGMNISYNIIKEHKGVINVKSKVGKGTTFDITLPGKE